MLTEWILIIWFTNHYPMGSKGETAPTVVARFSTIEQCKNAGNDWLQEHRDFECIKVQTDIRTKKENGD